MEYVKNNVDLTVKRHLIPFPRVGKRQSLIPFPRVGRSGYFGIYPNDEAIQQLAGEDYQSPAMMLSNDILGNWDIVMFSIVMITGIMQMELIIDEANLMNRPCLFHVLGWPVKNRRNDYFIIW